MENFAELETIEDFIEDAGIKMEVLPIHENPYRHSGDQCNAYHYSCKLISAEKRWFVVYFSKGLGLRLWQTSRDEFESVGKPLHVPVAKIGTQYDGPLPPFEGEDAELNRMIFERCSRPAAPYLGEVLDCVANDCYTIEATGGGFEAWCVLMKTSSDSIHAKRTFETCCQHRLKFHVLLGLEQYHRLVHEMGRSIPQDKSDTQDSG